MEDFRARSSPYACEQAMTALPARVRRAPFRFIDSRKRRRDSETQRRSAKGREEVTKSGVTKAARDNTGHPAGAGGTFHPPSQDRAVRLPQQVPPGVPPSPGGLFFCVSCGPRIDCAAPLQASPRMSGDSSHAATEPRSRRWCVHIVVGRVSGGVPRAQTSDGSGRRVAARYLRAREVWSPMSICDPSLRNRTTRPTRQSLARA